MSVLLSGLPPGTYLYCDRRFGQERWVWGDPADAVRIRDFILECVGFVCTPAKGGGVDCRGTGFFVGLPGGDDPDRGHHSYFVTARHNVKRQLDKGQPVIVRLNKWDGGVGLVEIAPSCWHFSDDPSVDVAVADFAPDIELYIARAFNVDMFATASQLYKYNVGPADNLLIIGLFTEHTGQQRNAPIVRTGTIAAMPTEPIYDSDADQSYRAHIVEIRSIGGLSGSPVLVLVHERDALSVRIPEGETSMFPMQDVLLLGLLKGRWSFGGTRFVPRQVDFHDDELKTVSMGMTTVVPADEILKILEGGKLTRARSEKEKAERRQRGTEDLSVPESEEEGTEYERFDALTRKLANTPKPKGEKPEGGR